ncbi:hypothetical protein V8E53_014183 [Lactarius tabidus]
MALPNSTLELNLNMGTAPPGLPMIALLLVPVNVSRVTVNLIPSPASGTGEGGGLGMVGQLTEPLPSTSIKGLCKEKEKPATHCAVDKLPLQCSLERGPTPSPWFTPSPQFKDSTHPCRLPLLHAPENLLKRANAAKAVAGPSCLVVTGSPQVIAGQDLLVLPPMPREVFNELTSMFDNVDSSCTELETSDAGAKRHKCGWDLE